MTQALPKILTFNEFIEWYPNDGFRYELHRGVIVEMPPPSRQTGLNSQRQVVLRGRRNQLKHRLYKLHSS